MASLNWSERLLAALGLPTTQRNIVFINHWQQAEGSKASYNPLATTQPAAGATNFNSVGVKNYTTEAQGLDATVKTLQNGRYGAVLEALRVSDTKAAARAVVASPWGTGKQLLALEGDAEGNAEGQGVTGGVVLGPGGIVPQAADAVKSVGDVLNILTDQGTWLRVLYVVGGLAAVVGGVVLLRAETVVKAGKAVSGAVPSVVAGKAVSAIPKAAAAAV